jgi:hypothetical protein
MGKQQHDNYPTPTKLAQAILHRSRSFYPDVVIEPSCGEGSFIKAARDVWPNSRIIGIDIVSSYRQAALSAGANEFVDAALERVIGDILESEQDGGKKVLVVGNPPFSLAQEHIEIIVGNLAQYNRLDFLLRLSFLGSTHRAENFWPNMWNHFDSLTPISGRPSYVKFKNVEIIETVDGVDYVSKRRKRVSTSDNSEYGIYSFVKGRSSINAPVNLARPMLWKDIE